MGFKELDFEPCPFLKDPFRQTFFSSFTTFIPELPSEAKIVPLSDGDKIVMEITTPKNWTETSYTVLCVHGLCGSHKSSYLCRLTNQLDLLGIKMVRFNMRGCGSGKGLAKQPYHSGRSEDLFEAIKVLKSEHPLSPIILIGFSLGGNVVLKMMGELGGIGNFFIDRVIAVSPPVDLTSCAARINETAAGLYERYFYRLLRKAVYELQEMFSDLPKVNLPKKLKLSELDSMYTASKAGCKDLQDYYFKCSSINWIGEISTRCKILFSQDDPIVASHLLDHLDLPSHIELYKTKRGGHMGYLGNPSHARGFFWLDSVLVDWILE